MAERAFVSIYEAASRTLGCRISVSGRVLSERMLPPVKAGEVREIAGQYISLMSKGWNSKTKEYLSLLGSGLFHIFLESDWGSIEGRISSGADLVIASQIPEVHRLPWEYIPVMGMALGRRFRILHHPMAVDELPTLSRLPPPGPLRLLFMGSAPLDHEGEALSVIRAAEGLDLILEIGETGTLQELRDLTAALRPHLVHLLAEGRMVEGEPRLVFQGETGRHDLRTAEELLEALEGVQSLLLSGHQAGMEPLDLLCQRAAATLPFAVRLTAPAGDLSLLYSALASGRPLKDALWAHAQSSDRPQPMPALYVGSDQEMLFDPGGRSEAAHDIERGVRPLPGMTEGYSRSFVGRRSELQGSLSALREGSVRAILITGADGSGRSTLATRLARSLGGPALTIYSSSSNPITSVRILEGGIRLLEGSGRQRDAIRLRDPSRSIDERLVELLDLLSQDGILIIVDGLADDVGKDPELEAIIQRLLRGTGPSRVIITSASLPDGNRQLPPQTRELHLEGLTESAFIVRLLRERTVADLYRQGSLGYRDLHDLFVTTAGSPSCLDQMAAALGSGGSIGSCGQALYFLTSSLDVRSAAALGRTAVYETAFDQAGLAAVAGTSEDEAGALAEEWERLSLVYRAGDLLAVPSSIRASLRDTMGSEDLQAARRAAAGHLRALAESSRSTELGLSRLDCLMEARGQSLAARDLEEARAVTSRISGYLEGRGYYRLLLRLNQELYDLEPHPTPAGWIARGHLDLGDYDQAEGWYRSLVRSWPDAWAHHGLGISYLRMGRHDLAGESLQRALDLSLAKGDSVCEAAALQGLSALERERGDFRSALLRLSRVLEVQEGLGDLVGQAFTLREMAMLDITGRDYEAARRRLLRASEILRAMKDPAGEASVLVQLGQIDLETGRLSDAREELGRAISLIRDTGERRGEASALLGLGMAEAGSGKRDAAVEALTGALRIYQDLSDVSGEAAALFQLGSLAVADGRAHEGMRLMALSAILLRGVRSEEAGGVEPVVERLASQLQYTERQFMDMVQGAIQSYRKDRGWALIRSALFR